MKKILFSLLLLIGAIGANAQTVQIYKAGSVVGTYADADSVVFRQVTVPVDEPTYAFSVSKRRQVVFSPGNLQYTRSTNTWAFAEHQYDIIGKANITDGALADKIDLFGWSASNTTAPFGVSLSQDNADYAGDFVDWGTNTIGTDAPNTWRTLTRNEWIYLFQHTRWTMAKVNNLLGFMLLPDGFVAPAGLTVAVLGNGNLSGTDLSFNESDYAGNAYTATEFAQLEAAGVVFLPCAGFRYGSEVEAIGIISTYWMASLYDEKEARNVVFIPTSANADNMNNRHLGKSVRLVQDDNAPAAGVKEIKTRVVTVYQPGDKAHRFADVDSTVVAEAPVPTNKFAIGEGQYVEFSLGNLQYTQSTNTWAFAANQYDIIGEANITDGALADKIDLFRWSTDNTATPFGVSLSTDKADYAGDFVDWGTNAIGTDAPNTWRTLTKDEWTYLFQHTHWTMAKVNDLLGFMLLPDGFVAPTGLTVAVLGDGNLSGVALSFNESDYASNVYTTDQFAQLESLGVVFLPCAGNHEVSNVSKVGYWSANSVSSSSARYLYCSSTYARAFDSQYRYFGQSVRLVKDL